MSEIISTLRKDCPELRAVPEGWGFKVMTDTVQRVFFVKDTAEADGTRITTYTHPLLGPLPGPGMGDWIFCVKERKGKWEGVYVSREKKNKETSENPRQSEVSLRLRNDHHKKISEAAWTTGAVVKTSSYKGIEDPKLARAPIGTKDIRAQFFIVKVLDDGTGQIGGMNAGVFVVCHEDNHNKFIVDKRFKADDGFDMARQEVKLMHELRHSSLAFYLGAFFDDQLNTASVYVEFCDLGSLENIVKVYDKERKSGVKPRPRIPERYIWHCFLGLCDGLAYLQGGRSFMDPHELAYIPVKNWTPMLHRDMKPDNVLIRSRSTTGSMKYPYCVISDFGLACLDDGTDSWQQTGLKMGTSSFYAPEMLYDPYPNSAAQDRSFPGSVRHSAKSDLYALGAIIFTMTALNGDLPTAAHITFKNRKQIAYSVWFQGTASRYRTLTGSPMYSPELLECIHIATRWEVEKRPKPIAMMKELRTRIAKTPFRFMSNITDADMLPGWVLKKHDYHHRVPAAYEKHMEEKGS